MSADRNRQAEEAFDKAFAMLVKEFRIRYDAAHNAVMKDFDAAFDRFFQNKTTGKSSDKEEK